MVVDLLLPLALAFIMFSLGLTLVPADFQRVFSSPRAMGAGLLGQLVCVPLIGYAVIQVWHLEGEMAVGVMILAACPGGASSGLLTMLAKGETALSISLTAVSSVVSALTMPLLVSVALSQFMTSAAGADISVGHMVRGVFFLTTVPVLLGMALKHFQPRLATRFAPVAGRIATLLFVLIVMATFISQRQVLLANLPTIGPAMVLLNVLTMGTGFGLAALSGVGRPGRIAVAIECSLHNAGLGIFVGATLLQTQALTVPSVVYALVMNFSAIAFVFWMRRPAQE